MGRILYKRTAAVALATFLVGAAGAQERIEAGSNAYTKEDDIELGREAAKEIEKQVQIVDDRQLAGYIEDMGERLLKQAPESGFPFTFKVVADPSINAFALPGGPVYIHTGVITAADDEAQLAGVMAHEISHVILRHSTSQATKSAPVGALANVLGAVLGEKGGVLGTLGQLGVGVGANALMLKYSRGAEREADIMGARMMSGAGWDPVQMARFFEKLESEGGGGMPQFFSDHPNPGNRVEYVREEIANYESRDYREDSPEFSKMKTRAQGFAASAQQPSQRGVQPSDEGAAAQAAGGEAQGPGYNFRYPREWGVSAERAGVTAAPEGGVVSAGGGSSVVRGVVANMTAAEGSLEESTDALIQGLEQANSGLAELRGQRESTRVGGEPALSTRLEGPSALGDDSRELVWLVTVRRPQGLFSLAMVAPMDEVNRWRDDFEEIVESVSFEPER